MRLHPNHGIPSPGPTGAVLSGIVVFLMILLPGREAPAADAELDEPGRSLGVHMDLGAPDRHLKDGSGPTGQQEEIDATDLWTAAIEHMGSLVGEYDERSCSFTLRCTLRPPPPRGIDRGIGRSDVLGSPHLSGRDPGLEKTREDLS